MEIVKKLNFYLLPHSSFNEGFEMTGIIHILIHANNASLLICRRLKPLASVWDFSEQYRQIDLRGLSISNLLSV
jgi:hypothetical protein